MCIRDSSSRDPRASGLRVRALHPPRTGRSPRARARRLPGRAGARAGAPKIGRCGEAGVGAGPRLRAPAPIQIPGARATQERHPQQPLRADGRRAPAVPPSLPRADGRCLPA
eukprot:925424-Alexandrium_andersonii.AAC.1